MFWAALLLLLCAYPSTARSSVRPGDDIRDVQWSSDSLNLLRRDTMFTYHNYTIIEEPSGYSTTRYIRRQVLPHHNRILQNHGPRYIRNRRLTERGFILNPNVPANEAENIGLLGPGDSQRYVTWNWKRPDVHCPALIPLCFPNPNHEKDLGRILNDALDMWSMALGENAGVRFVLAPADPAHGKPKGICYSPNGEWNAPAESVVIAIASGGHRAYNGIGWKPRPPGSPAGWMAILFDPGDDASPPAHAENVATMAHELGHVLGLEHEHQRYDARQHITYFPDNVRNMNLLPDLMDEIRDDLGDDELTEEDLKDDRFLVYQARLKEYHDIPLQDLLPFRKEDNGFQLIDFELKGEFDWNSIMLYGSTAESHDGTSYTMVRQDDGLPFPEPQTISRGDIDAVKHIYPDNQERLDVDLSGLHIGDS